MKKPKASKPSRMPAKEPAKPVPASPPAPAPAEKPKSLAAKGAVHLYGRLLGVMKSRGAEEVTESQSDFATYAFTELAPKNAAEVMLCAQMVSVWEAGMAMLSAAKSSTDFRSLEAQGTLAAKLLSIFERQFSTLERARRPPQTVVVRHEHRHIHVGGQVPGQTGDVSIIEGQAYEPTDPRALATAPSPALLSQDAPRDAVPLAGDEARPLPNARRRSRNRSSER